MNRQIKCSKCGYEWTTNSKLLYISCPSCLTKIPNTSMDHKLLKKREQQKEVRGENGDNKNNQERKLRGN